MALRAAVVVLPFVFGLYLAQQKVLRPLQTGLMDERAGLIEQSTDPQWFWASVAMYGFISLTIMLISGWLGWLMLRNAWTKAP